MADAHAPAAPAPSGLLRVSVVTPEGPAYEGEAASVVVPAHDGEVAFLAGHAPFVGALGTGEMRVTSGGATRRFYLAGGVVQVLDGNVVVLAETVKPAEKVDAAAARADLQAALKVVPTTDEAFDRRDRALEAARARIRVAGSRPS